MSYIFDSDKLFKDSPDVGKKCICSRCSQPILKGVPIRAFLENGNSEYRFHQNCYFESPVNRNNDNYEDEDDYDDDGLTTCKVCGDVDVSREIGVCSNCQLQKTIDDNY